MSTNPIALRQALLSADPIIKHEATIRLGVTNPHQELVTISSALIIDAHRSIPSLSIQQVRQMLNATCSHLAMFPLLTETAQEDIVNKSWDVKYCAIKWAAKNAPTELVEYILMLKEELHSLLGIEEVAA